MTISSASSPTRWATWTVPRPTSTTLRLSTARQAKAPELAWSQYDYADMLLERNNEGDRQKGMQLLEESLAISTELGMRPLMERVLSQRDILKA